MITFNRFQGGIYLTEAGSSNPANARVGFLFQDAGKTDPTFVLSPASYPNCQGYFAFFLPSATRDWNAFANSVRSLFANIAQSQFGWFSEGPDNAVSAVTLIQVASQESSPFVQSPFSLTFNNVALTLQATPFSPATISFDDATNVFTFLNPNTNALLLTVIPPSQPQQTFLSVSPNLVLAMDDSTLQASCVNAAFQLTRDNLSNFEAGFMYFGQPVQGVLPALNYPVFFGSAGASSPMNLNAWLDVLQPLVGTQTYFQFTDPALGGYFTTNNGKILSFTTVNATPATQISRLVFANRPVKAPTDTGTYYLTPAGSFGLSLPGVIDATLLCGMTGTELLNVNLGGSADSLFFQPGQAAYQLTTPGQGFDPPSFLSTGNGNVTTSWAQLVTSTGSYVSQPQESPLYQQTDSAVADSGLTLYLLDFNALPSWSAQTALKLDATDTIATPLVPMVPFSGLAFNTSDQAKPYVSMELTAINPTRKNNFSASSAAALKSARKKSARKAKTTAPAGLTSGSLTYSMTPQGLLAGIDASNVWQTTQIAISDGLTPGDPQDILQITSMGDQIREALQQNQIFLVISTLVNPTPPPSQLFSFAGSDQTINIAGWPFSISPAGTPSSDGTPPIVILKFWPGQSIKELVDDSSLWSQAAVFNNTYGVDKTQAYIQSLIQQACEAVYGEGNCPQDGTPNGQPDTSSIYYNFWQVVNNSQFTGLLALNANMQLDSLPIAIKAVTGGMTIPNDDPPPDRKSNIDAFRVHHVGVSINDTDPASGTPALAQSSLFGLVDYEKPSSTAKASAPAADGLSVDYSYEVEFLRALFTNSTLSSFSCQINLTINNLFGTDVTEESNGAGAGDDDNVIVITGSYQAHSTSGDDSTSGEGVYSFVAEGNFNFNFAENPYLKNIALTKLQFSFDQETQSTSDTSTIQASFGIWGNLVFNEFKALDIFAFQQLVFNDLGISVSFDLSLPPGGQPSTSVPVLTFNPGNLRLDLANSTPREGGSPSLLSMLPFKLTSFLYNQYPDQQTVEDLQYYSLSSVPLDTGFKLVNQFNYALLFDLDLGTLGALVGSLEAFKFSFLIGWLTDDETGGIAFGVQLPQADGKLEINIEGVLKLTIEEFILRYANDEAMLVVALHNWSLTVLGQRLPPEGQFDLALFAPTSGSAHIGWIVAYNNMDGGNGGTGEKLLSAGRKALADGNGDNGGDGGKSPVFELKYLGLGQRTGPDPSSPPPTTFADFMTFMTTDFWDAVKNEKYGQVYHPDGQWLAVTDFKLLGTIEVGFVFYDVTPFYSLTLNVEKLFNFEITYTKVSDSIGLFYANFSLPDSLRNFQVGAASLTLPSIGVSVYTNGDWKLDVGFPNGDDWSRCFRVQAQAGPVPVTGAGGFYLARLSSATSNIFPNSNYPLIVAFGFAARLGVGKDFTSGPLKAGVSVTFFGIIEGAAGYLSSGSTDIFQTPDGISLKGQFGIIGELYGSIDFVIIKASVNVRLQASIGIVMLYQRSDPNSGSILLYIEASVSVSVKVEIDLGLFSISISFSFRASFRFEWQLLSPGSSSPLLHEMKSLRMRRMSRLAAMAVDTATMPILPLISGFTTTLGLWYLPEGTVVFPAATGTGTPWVANSIGVQYNPSPSGTPPYSSFFDFEKLTTQLVTWAVGYALDLPGSTYTVTQDQMSALDQTPESLVGSIDYATLLQQLAVFSTSTVSVPTASASATTFPMPPFFQLQTNGRLNSSNQPDDLEYVFSSQNNVPTSYITQLDAYFNQLFVNQTAGDGATLTATLNAAGATIPLIQEIFLDYFTGVIRGAVHQLLQTMQNNALESSPINTLISTAVGAGELGTLAGQMSSSFRGGARLPYTAGMTVPGGAALTTTNPLYALLWQEFPAGTLGSSNQYTIQLTNADSTQKWVTPTVNWALTSSWLTPFAQAQATSIVAPAAPQQLPFTDVGPQAFAFQNPTVWTQPGNVNVNLYPFAANLLQLQSITTGNINVLVESREGGAPYLPGGTPLPPSMFTWATQIELTVSQVPDGQGNPLPDVFALSGASQSDQQLLEQIINAISGSNPIAAIQVLYQSSAGSSGLTSDTIDPTQVFALRTNTTTVSVPPPSTLMMLATVEEEPAVPVGAEIDDDSNFLQIIQQASVTNAPGYYLRYINTSDKSLPADLFTAGPAPLTFLITYKPDGSLNTPASPAQIRSFYNAIVLTQTTAGLIYYAETTDADMDTQYNSVAAGAVGVVMSRDDSAMLMTPGASLMTACGANGDRRYRRSELVRALLAAGETDMEKMRALVADSGGTASQLNALYSLVTYQVQQTSGFITSNLSAPVQPTQPDDDSAAADGVTLADDDDTRLYRVFVPLYNLAVANQQPSDAPANRYASIPDPINITFYQNDAFGNQMPAQQTFNNATNDYFDPIVGIDQWQGVVTAYDFLVGTSAQPNTVTVYLEPSEDGFTGSDVDTASQLSAYYTIYDQLTGPGVTLYLETNLALDSSGNMVKVALTAAQTKGITDMVSAIIAYLKDPSQPFNVPGTTVSVAVTNSGTLPPAFELAVLLGIERDIDLISPLIKDNGVCTFPSAQNRYSNIVPTVGSSIKDATASVDITTFASFFVTAFPAFTLAVGLGGATESTQVTSTSARTRRALKASGVPSDSTGSGSAASSQSLWAVQSPMLGITIGTAGNNPGPFYQSPMPLDNTLNTQLVPLPSLPAPIQPPNWASSQLFTDIDLDTLNSAFFAAVDGFLGPASAAYAFENARDAYTTVAEGRRSIADKFSVNEIDWLFGSGAPFTGTAAQLTDGQTAFGQQMRAALSTAYTTDTIVQYNVSWTSQLPPGIGDLYQLYGMIQPAGGAEQPGGFTFSASWLDVPVTNGDTSTLTFMFGVADIQESARIIPIDLQYNVTHVQHFLHPAGDTPEDEARPSIWLQLVNPYPQGVPHLGPSGTQTQIPVVFRQYPTPPTVINQTATQGAGGGTVASTSSNPLTEAAAWHLNYSYQAQLTQHDQLATNITYNTDLSASSGGGSNSSLALAADQTWTLFEALARFSATFAVLSPILTDLSAANLSNWILAAQSFAGLVTGVVTNSTWTPTASLLATGLRNITDSYTVTDVLQTGTFRQITMTWDPKQGESSFDGVSLAIEAISPVTNEPYPNQTPGTTTNGITDLYTPDPPLVDFWVIHQVEVDNLNVLIAENALGGAQVQRNVIQMTSSGQTYTAQQEFIYNTPVVRATQPITPLVDSSAPIDVATLPNQGIGSGCPSAPPPGVSSLCQRIYTMMYDLLADTPTLTSLVNARLNAGLDESAARRVKVACSFQYPVASASGISSANPVSPLYPVVLARSFVIDATQPGQLSAFSSQFATKAATWASDSNVAFGAGAQTGAQFVFDITLYAQLSGLNTPVLRLRNLQLGLKDIAV